MVRRKAIEAVLPSRLEIQPAIPPADDGAPVLYAIEIEAGEPIVHVAPDDQFMDRFEVEITRRERGRPPELAGRCLAIRLRVEDAHAAGCSVRRVIETGDEDLSPYWDALFDPRTGDIKGWLKENWRLAGSNLLILSSLSVLPEHRGRNLGLATATRLIEALSGGCSLIACRPVPAQFCRPIPDDGFQAALRLDEFPQDERIATGRVRWHWRKLGFRRVGRTHTYAMPNDRFR